ncbi:unnamed protein product, partial [Discosporangium mesarthrocarpum]
AWEAIWDAGHGAYYYHHKKTGVTKWERPTYDNASAASPLQQQLGGPVASSANPGLHLRSGLPQTRALEQAPASTAQICISSVTEGYTARSSDLGSSHGAAPRTGPAPQGTPTLTAPMTSGKALRGTPQWNRPGSGDLEPSRSGGGVPGGPATWGGPQAESVAELPHQGERQGHGQGGEVMSGADEALRAALIRKEEALGRLRAARLRAQASREQREAAAAAAESAAKMPDPLPHSLEAHTKPSGTTEEQDRGVSWAGS